MISDLFTWVLALLSHWAAFMTGGIPAALFYVLERYREKQFSWRAYFYIFVVFGFVAASYQGWHEEYEQNHRASEIRREHIVQLQNFSAQLEMIIDEPIQKDMSKQDFDAFARKASEVANTAGAWIEKNMGKGARNKYFDRTGMQAARYSKAINDEHNNILLNLTRLHQNLDALISNPVWDKVN